MSSHSNVLLIPVTALWALGTVFPRIPYLTGREGSKASPAVDDSWSDSHETMRTTTTQSLSPSIDWTAGLLLSLGRRRSVDNNATEVPVWSSWIVTIEGSQTNH